jgi:hypothetical protein
MNTVNLSGKKQFHRYVGNIEQLCGIKEYELKSGKAKGVKAFDVKNGIGLEYTVLLDRCLDISNLTFKGVNCSYLSKTGIVAPEYNESGTNFLNNFFAGFFTTCGLRNVGNACVDNGEMFNQHGKISNIPAEEVCVSTDWVEAAPEMTISGKIREATFFGENILLERKITCRFGENRIKISNVIENQGFKPEVLMLLLHFNIGYPLLDECSRFLSSSKEVIPRDAEAAKGINEHNRFQSPTHNYAEQVFYHDLNADSNGDTVVALINPDLEIGVSLRFDKKQFSQFAQWKQMGEGEYILGMEPCNCYVGGRTDPLNKKSITYLQPFEKKHFDVVVDLYSGSEQLKKLDKAING